MYDYDGQKKYNSQSIILTCSYRPHEIEDAQMLKKYLNDTNQTANKYLKSLIHKDLLEKGLIKEKVIIEENCNG